jgi:hypothetical protein
VRCRSALPLFLRLRPDTKLTLDARGSKDLDGDALTSSWFHYEEAGRTLQASSPDVTLSRTTGKKISVTPRGMGHAHIILTVMDDEEHRVAIRSLPSATAESC